LKYAGLFHWNENEPAILARTAPTVILHGHIHIRHAVSEGNLLQIGVAALIEPPHEVAVIEIDERDGALTVSAEHHSVADFETDVLPVLSPDRSVWTYREGAWAAV
jgi:hypothetical protein